MLLGLPVAGFVSGWLYLRYGRDIERGNALLIDEVHDPKRTLPLRMAPMVLIGTLMTHLFGGSAGREGAAVQMAASLTDQLSKGLNFTAEDRRVLLMAGMSAGFASVFGTPLAGAVFGLEIFTIGKVRYEALFTCMVAAIVGHETALALGTHHTLYPVISSVPVFSLPVFVSCLIAGLCFGGIGMLFSWGVHIMGDLLSKWVSYAPLRPVVGGMVLAGFAFVLPLGPYLGLGIPNIKAAFFISLPWWAFLAKTGTTILTLGSGFKGGEVTPLFFIGASLGNTLSSFLPMSLPVLTALGFVGVFSGAANVPLTGALMAMELFGTPIGIAAFMVCVVSAILFGYSKKLHEGRLK